MFVRVADHSRYAGQRSNFFRSALRITSGDDDFCRRILPLHSPNGGARILIGGTGHGAGIQNDEVGSRG